MTTTKAVLLTLTSAILAFNVGTHLETSKVAKIKLTHYKQCVRDIVDELGYDDSDHTFLVIRNECGELLWKRLN